MLSTTLCIYEPSTQSAESPLDYFSFNKDNIRFKGWHLRSADERLVNSYFEQAAFFLYVIDLSKELDHDKVQKDINLIKEKKPGAPIILLGKKDKHPSLISKADFLNLQKEYEVQGAVINKVITPNSDLVSLQKKLVTLSTDLQKIKSDLATCQKEAQLVLEQEIEAAQKILETDLQQSTTKIVSTIKAAHHLLAKDEKKFQSNLIADANTASQTAFTKFNNQVKKITAEANARTYDLSENFDRTRERIDLVLKKLKEEELLFQQQIDQEIDKYLAPILALLIAEQEKSLHTACWNLKILNPILVHEVKTSVKNFSNGTKIMVWQALEDFVKQMENADSNKQNAPLTFRTNCQQIINTSAQAMSAESSFTDTVAAFIKGIVAVLTLTLIGFGIGCILGAWLGPSALFLGIVGAAVTLFLATAGYTSWAKKDMNTIHSFFYTLHPVARASNNLVENSLNFRSKAKPASSTPKIDAELNHLPDTLITL